MKNVITLIKNVVSIYMDKNISRASAGVCFFIVLSLFPLLICLNWLIGMLHLNISDMILFFNNIIPESTLSIISEYITYVSNYNSDTIIVLGLFLTATTLSSAFRSLLVAVDDIHSIKTKRGIKDLFFTYIVPILLLSGIYFLILSFIMILWLLQALSIYQRISMILKSIFFYKHILLLIIIFPLIYLLFRYLYKRGGQHRIYTLISSFICTLGLVIASEIFSFFIKFSPTYNIVYGSLTSIIILMVWLFTITNIIMLGIIFDYALYKKIKKEDI